jgi:cytochrome c biogenesis protein CcmG/thiol:disulfide interchange protein DsbE
MPRRPQHRAASSFAAWKVVAVAVLVVTALAVLAVVGLASHGQSGRRAPALARERLAGPPVTLASLLATAHGGAVVVFWASWCGPCEKEAPALERFARSPAGRGRIVGVDWSDARGGARGFISRYAWSFPNVRDGDGSVGEAYHLTGLPTTFVLDAHGTIRAVLRGPQDEASLTRALAYVDTT